MAQEPIFAQSADGKFHEFDPGTPVAVIDRVMAEYARAHGAPPVVSSPGSNPLAARAGAMSAPLRGAAEFLPDIGGALGAMALPAGIGMARGAPLGPWGMLGGGILGAALGAIPGELGREAAAGTPPDARAVGMQMGRQGALELGGNLLMRPAVSLARATYRGALRPSVDMIRNFPETVNTMLRERIPLGDPTRRSFGIPGGQTGEQIVGGKLAGAKATRDVMLDTAEGMGRKIPRDAVLKHVNELVAETGRGRVHVKERMQLLNDELDKFFRDNPTDLTPNEAKRLKQSAQKIARDIYEGRGGDAFGEGALRKQFFEAQARGTREGLEAAVPNRGRLTFGQAEQRVGNLGGAEEAVQHGLEQMRMGRGGSIPMIPSFAQGAIPAMLRSPNMMSRAALFLHDPRLLALIAQEPRLAAALFFPPGGAPSDQTQAPRRY